jgi:hypothetical protein
MLEKVAPEIELALLQARTINAIEEHIQTHARYHKATIVAFLDDKGHIIRDVDISALTLSPDEDLPADYVFVLLHKPMLHFDRGDLCERLNDHNHHGHVTPQQVIGFTFEGLRRSIQGLRVNVKISTPAQFHVYKESAKQPEAFSRCIMSSTKICYKQSILTVSSSADP